jgi:hypothetical protein
MATPVLIPRALPLPEYPADYFVSSSYTVPPEPLYQIGFTDFVHSCNSTCPTTRSSFQSSVTSTSSSSFLTPRISEEEEENKHNDAKDYAVKFSLIGTSSSSSSVSLSSNQASSSKVEEETKVAEEDVKEADSRLVVSKAVHDAAFPIVVHQNTLVGRVWGVVDSYSKLPNSQALKLLENELRLLSAVLNHYNRNVLLNIATSYMLLKDPQFAVTKIATAVGLNSRFVEVLANTGAALASAALNSVFGSNTDSAASSQEDVDPLTAGEVAAGLFERYTGEQNKSPDQMVQHLLRTHSSAVVVREDDPMVALEEAYDKQWRVQQSAKQAQRSVVSSAVNAASKFLSTSSVKSEEAQKLATNLVNAMGQGITQTFAALQAQDKEANERLSSTEKMLHAFFRGENANNHPVVQAMVDKVTDLIADAIESTSANVGMQHMKFRVGKQAVSKLIQWGSAECLGLMKESKPELFAMLEGIVESDAIKAAVKDAGVVADAFNKASFIGHLWVYADHWQTVMESLFDAQGNLSFNALLASDQANPKLAHAFLSICSIFSRDKSPDKYAGYLKSGMAAYELYNYVSSTDAVAFSNRLQEAVEADGFFDEEGQKLVQSCNDEFTKFWTASRNPHLVKVVENFHQAMSKAKGVRIIMAPDALRSLNDAFKAGIKRATDVPEQDKVVAIVADVAMNHVPVVVSKAVKIKVAFDKADYYEAGVNVFKFFSSGLMAAGDVAVQNKLYVEAGKAKDAATDVFVDKVDFDSILATLAAQGYTFTKEFSRGMEGLGQGEEEHKVRMEISEVPADALSAASAHAILAL